MVSVRDAFGRALAELGKENKDIVVLDADLASSSRVNFFAEEFPDRFFEMGVAEQNMMGVAAGFASVGKIPFVSTFAVFATKRACDQVTISVAYPNLNVKIIGAYTGIVSGNNGATHQAIEDISIIRAIPNMVIIDPADAEEMRQVVKEIVEYKGPVYMRETRDEWPDIFDKSYRFVIGKAAEVRSGDDVTIIACGVMTSQAIEASKMLARRGIKARVVNMSTIKPIDRDMIIKCAKETGVIVTAENHNIYGGLGSAVSEVLVEEFPVPLLRVGIKDTFGECGSNRDLLKKYNMDPEYIVETVKKVLVKKKESR